MSTVNLFGLDSTSEVSPAAHHAVGSHFAMRYLSHYTSKVVTRKELLDASANGLYLGVVFEDSARSATGGYAVGKAHAEFAKKQAYDLLGKPSNPKAMIPAAVDFDGQWSQVSSYFEGQASVLGDEIAGPYGSYGICADAYSKGLRGIWQTYAWSGGRFFDKTKVFQYSNDHLVGGIGTDYDHAYDLTAFWNYKPANLDPHHYLYFDVGPFKWGKFSHMNEREIVERYDLLRSEQSKVRHPHRQELNTLREQCKALADRVAYVASKGSNTEINPQVWQGNWSAFHRKDRYTGLINRWQGKRVVG